MIINLVAGFNDEGGDEVGKDGQHVHNIHAVLQELALRRGSQQSKHRVIIDFYSR